MESRSTKRKREVTNSPINFDIPNPGIPPVLSCELTITDLRELGEDLDIEKTVYKYTREMSRADTACTILRSIIPERCIPLDWEFTEVLGKGAYGTVIGTKGPNNERGALKLIRQRDSESARKEYSSGIKFNKMGIGPEVKSHCSFIRGGNKVHAIHMSRIDGTISTYLQGDLTDLQIYDLVQKLFHVIYRIANRGCTHMDFHLSNVGFVYSNPNTIGKLVVIDHGKVTHKKSFIGIDILQMIRGNLTGFSSRGVTNKKNLQLFETLVREKASSELGITFPTEKENLKEQYFIMRENAYDYL